MKWGVRHGEVLNPDHVIYAGLPGFGLSDLGREQADAAAETLKSYGVKTIVASPLQRARETAEIIANVTGANVTYDERLVEWKFWSRWAGIAWDDLAEQDPATLETYLRDPGELTEGETVSVLSARVVAVVNELPDGGAIVSHLEPLRAYFVGVRAMPTREMGSIEIPTGGIVSL